MFTFWGVSRLFSKVSYFTFLTAVYEGSNFPTSSPVLVLHERVSSLHRGNANLLCNSPILVYMLLKQELTHLFIIHTWIDIPLWFWFTICIHFLETCLFRSFLIFSLVYLFIFEFWESFIHFRCTSLIRYMICKYFLPFSGLSFHFLDYVSCSTKVLVLIKSN